MPKPKPAAAPLKRKPVPIIEYDPSRRALLEPARLIKPLQGMPPRVVICFFQEVIRAAIDSYGGRKIASLRSELGEHPVYEIESDEGPVAVAHPGVGAPLAAGTLEELIALGGRKFIACGGAGVLDPSLAVGHLIVPNAAVRDEGTSYHYLPPARTVAAHPAAIKAIRKALAARDVPYVLATTWTTDALYRETPARIAARRKEGCVTVEMEAAAFFAVAEFRKVKFGQILYAGDDVSGEIWDSRQWNAQEPLRQRVFDLAIESVLRL